MRKVGSTRTKIVVMYNEGLASEQIAEGLGVRLGYVHEVVSRARKAGDVERPAPRARSEPMVAAVGLYRAGMRPTDIAEAMGTVSPNHVNVLLGRARKAGLLGPGRVPGEGRLRCAVCKAQGHNRLSCSGAGVQGYRPPAETYARVG